MYHVKEEQRILEVWVALRVPDDTRVTRLSCDLELDGRRVDGEQLVGAHIADAPTEHFERRPLQHRTHVVRHSEPSAVQRMSWRLLHRFVL